MKWNPNQYSRKVFQMQKNISTCGPEHRSPRTGKNMVQMTSFALN